MHEPVLMPEMEIITDVGRRRSGSEREKLPIVEDKGDRKRPRWAFPRRTSRQAPASRSWPAGMASRRTWLVLSA